MFYYPTVLQRHTGCFSTIWLVATKGIRVTRRDFLKVNVIRTCDDIMNYVLEQVPPPWPGLPRPRFSLYLSSQLQYGVILVYHRQCAIFLEELHSIVGQLTKQVTQKIDLDGHSRQAVDLLDALSLMEEAEGALDPLFGLMYMQEPIASPNTLMQIGQMYLRPETSPQHPELTDPTAAAALESGITASPDSITLREMEPLAIHAAEFEGEELVDQHPDTIDLLMAQMDNFPEEDLELPREEVTPEREIERGRSEEDLGKEGTKELPGSSIELQPTTLSSEDATLLPQEELDLHVDKPGPRSDQLTPVSLPPVPPLPPAAEEASESDASPPKAKPSRPKKQLIFFDPVTQITQEVLQQQIDNHLIETRHALFPPSLSERMPPAAELFKKPCTTLHEEVELLWRRAATIQSLQDSDLQVGRRGPVKERGGDELEAAWPAGQPEMEVRRAVAEPEMLDISDHGSLLLEGSDQREVTREIAPLLESEKEGSTVSRPASALQEIPEVVDEVVDEVPESAAAPSPGLLPDLPMSEVGGVVFQSLHPSGVDRRTVSKAFQRLLEHVTARKLRVQQDEPYGDILILPGVRYDEVHPTV